ncbi:MAG: hydrogenase nickel incorporation protein HypB [Lachnospiraceae bacterium]|nr:hydrogenase nickel incorporation protein HypB [Lachnospiraceae bacterium]
MDRVQVIELKESILENNDQDAALLRDELKDKGVFYLNVMSSPGSGKTTTILQILKRLSGEFRVGVMEADIDSSVDALKVQEAGYPAVQLHTGGMCHLDAQMSRQGMQGLPEDTQVVILENVGNLVCPAEFDTGAVMNLVILSVPEGDDKPLKYPLMFEKCQAAVINKIDAMPAFDFDLEKASAAIRQRNPEMEIFPISAASGEGVDALCEYLSGQIRKWLAAE